MSIVVRRSAVTPELGAHATTWRYLRRDGPDNVGIGVAEFRRRPDDGSGDEPGEAHDVPEVHYVVSGVGVLVEEGETIPIRAGDAVLTPAGRRHTVWATSDEPLVTVYVAVGRGAFDPPVGS